MNKYPPPGIETLLLTVTLVLPLSDLMFYPVDSGLPVSLPVRVPTFSANSLLKRSARTAVPGGLVAGRLLVFWSQRGAVSHCSLGVNPRWPGGVAVPENAASPSKHRPNL